MFGGEKDEILNLDSKFNPKSPYAASKLFSFHLTKLYRESYGQFCVNGILFNHESPLRGETFVTRKISKAVGRIYFGLQSKLTLGNLEAKRDWGFAGDYVLGMWLMMQHSIPRDWILSTGESHSVEEFLDIAFNMVNLDWKKHVIISEKYKRPNEVKYLKGDSSEAETILGWKRNMSFKELVELMVKEDMKIAEQEKLLLSNGLINPTWEYHS